MIHIVRRGGLERLLSEENHPIQAFFFQAVPGRGTVPGGVGGVSQRMAATSRKPQARERQGDDEALVPPSHKTYADLSRATSRLANTSA